MQHDFDLVIVGGGLAGNCLALALKQSGLRCAIIEAGTRKQRRDSPAGDRALALSSGTMNILTALGIWQGVEHRSTLIKRIHVSDQGHFAKTRLSAQREKVAALGYVITARVIEEHVADLVEQADLTQICPARLAGLMAGENEICLNIKQQDDVLNLSARVVVGADGGNSSVRRLLEIPQRVTQYRQAAIVTTLKPAIHHHYTAYERFTADGPLAMLPDQAGRCAVVWTRRQEDMDNVLHCNEAQFIDQLQNCFGYKLGELTLTAPRRGFPLRLVQAERMFSARAVIIGNAVHQLHPVAGQGFNLGLRDAAQLAEMLIEQHSEGRDIGACDFLAEYARLRRQDHERVIGFTDKLVRIFSKEWLPMAAARGVGLVLLDHSPAAKRYFAQYAMGLAGRMARVGSRS